MPVKEQICFQHGFGMMFKSQTSGMYPSGPNQGCTHASVSMRLSISFTERVFPPSELQIFFLFICCLKGNSKSTETESRDSPAHVHKVFI